MVYKKLSLLLFLNIFLRIDTSDNSNLAVVGPLKFSDGIFRLSITWIEQLRQDLKIDFISTGYVDLDNVSESVKNIVLSSENAKNKPADVAVLLSSPWTFDVIHANHVPESKIKIAYSMLESTKIPEKWVEIFNNKFDSVVVPDQYLIKVYKDSGVKIPIFLLPCGLFLEDFLNKPIKKKANDIFKFGISATFTPDKNHKMAVQAFAEAFGNNKKVELHLHGRGGDDSDIRKEIKKLNLQNVYIANKSLIHQEYVDFLSSLDCYVLLSKGEGFSITPRECMALGIPCILSNNTAQKTICETGLIESVKSEIAEPSYYYIFQSYVGNKFNCSVKDASHSFRKVFNNYSLYLKKSQSMRNWARNYEYKVLKPKYLSLIKPKKILLGDKNFIGDDFLMTDSYDLYNKYLEINLKNRGNSC